MYMNTPRQFLEPFNNRQTPFLKKKKKSSSFFSHCRKELIKIIQGTAPETKVTIPHIAPHFITLEDNFLLLQAQELSPLSRCRSHN
jgi:hypothetical protein